MAISAPKKKTASRRVRARDSTYAEMTINRPPGNRRTPIVTRVPIAGVLRLVPGRQTVSMPYDA